MLQRTDADIRRVDADFGTASLSTCRTLCQTTATRHLTLLGLKLSVSDAHAIIESHAPTLARIALSISHFSTTDRDGRILLPHLTHLRVECLHPDGSTTLLGRKECINAAWTLMLHLDMPQLLELDIAGVCLTGSHYASILSYLSPTPKLQVLRLRQSFGPPANEYAICVRDALQLSQDLQQRGASLRLAITAKVDHPVDRPGSARFEDWLPFYYPLAHCVDRLNLTFDLTTDFPPDIQVWHSLEFPVLEDFQLVLNSYTPYYRIGRVLSKLRAPKLRSWAVEFRMSGGDTLFHMLLAMLPNFPSLESFSIKGRSPLIHRFQSECTHLCDSLDIVCSFE